MPRLTVIRLHADDDVLIAARQLAPGTTIESGNVTVRDPIPPGHKLAARNIKAGAPMPEISRRIFGAIIRCASGERSRSEALGYGADEFIPWQIGAVM